MYYDFTKINAIIQVKGQKRTRILELLQRAKLNRAAFKTVKENRVPEEA